MTMNLGEAANRVADKAKTRKQERLDHEFPENEQLNSLVERICRLEDEKATIGEDIKEVYDEAEGHGYDKKALKQVVKIKRKPIDLGHRQTVNQYLRCLGELPLFSQMAN